MQKTPPQLRGCFKFNNNYCTFSASTREAVNSVWPRTLVAETTVTWSPTLMSEREILSCLKSPSPPSSGSTRGMVRRMTWVLASALTVSVASASSKFNSFFASTVIWPLPTAVTSPTYEYTSLGVGEGVGAWASPVVSAGWPPGPTSEPPGLK